LAETPRFTGVVPLAGVAVSQGPPDDVETEAVSLSAAAELETVRFCRSRGAAAPAVATNDKDVRPPVTATLGGVAEIFRMRLKQIREVQGPRRVQRYAPGLEESGVSR